MSKLLEPKSDWENCIYTGTRSVSSCHVETVVCLSKKNMKPKEYVEISVNTEEYYKIKAGK